MCCVQVSAIMVECARHVNLVRVPLDTNDSNGLISQVLSECDSKQRSLLSQLINILEVDKLAKLAYSSVSIL